MSAVMTIRPAVNEDFAAIWPIFQTVVSAGDTFVYAPDTSREEAYRICMTSPGQKLFVAEIGSEIVGSCYVRPNQPGLGSHVANAGFMVSPDARGQGIGRAMCRHCIEQAAKLGFRAMQFNYVVSTNESALKLWLSEGFAIIGTIPEGFQHSRLGYVDVFIMYRTIGE